MPPELNNICTNSTPLNGVFSGSATIFVPSRGADPARPVIVDTHLLPMGLNGGLVRIEAPTRGIRCGALDLSGPLANIRGARLRALREDIYPDWMPSWIGVNILFRPEQIFLNDGSPTISGQVEHRSRFSDEPHRLWWPFGLNQDLNLLSQLPLGFNYRDELICDDERDWEVDHDLPTTRRLRDGIPSPLDFPTMIGLGLDVSEMAAAGGCPQDPDLHINPPTLIARDPQNPLSALPYLLRARTNGVVNIAGQTMEIQPDPEHPYRFSPMTIDFGDGPNLASWSVAFDNPRLRDQLRRRDQPAEHAQLVANLLTTFDFQQIRIHDPIAGERSIHLPIQGVINTTAQVDGPPSPRLLDDVLAQIFLHGVITQEGNIEVINIEGVPDITVERSNNPNQLISNLSISYLSGGHVRLLGNAQASLDIQSAQMGDRILDRPLSAQAQLTADEQGVLIDLSGRMALPSQAFPVHFSDGHVTLPYFHLLVAPDIRIDPTSVHHVDHVSGNIDGMVNLTDISGSSGEHLFQNISGQIHTSGDFSIENDLVTLNILNQLNLSGHLNGNTLQSDAAVGLRLQDTPYQDSETGERRVTRMIQLSDLSLLGPLNADIGAVQLRGDASALQNIQVTLNSSLRNNPLTHPLGYTSQAHFTAEVHDLRITIPRSAIPDAPALAGTLNISGQVSGDLSLLNRTSETSVPELAPRVGGIRIRIDNARIRRNGETLASGITLHIRDEVNEAGQPQFVVRAELNGHLNNLVGQLPGRSVFDGILNGIENFLRGLAPDLGRSVRTARENSRDMIPSRARLFAEGIVIPMNSEAIASTLDPDSYRDGSAVTCTADSASCEPEDGDRYYNIGGIQDVSIPSFLVRAIIRNLGRIDLRGHANLQQIQSESPHASYEASLPIRQRSIPYRSRDGQTRGTITVLPGRFSVRGSESGSSSRLRIRGFRINLTQTREDGSTIQQEGELLMDGSISTRVDMERQRLRIPRRRHRLQGNLTITERNAAGEIQSQNRTAVDTTSIVSGSGNLRHGRLRIRIPENIVTEEVLHGFETGGVRVAPETRVRSQQGESELTVDINVRALLRGR